jgi:predicted DNA-binding transcriptional regulator YafY
VSVWQNRCLFVYDTLQKSPGIQTKVLAELFGRTPRTIQRDICNLRKMGFNIDSSSGAAGGFASRGSYYLKLLVFSGVEALAIFIAIQIMG